MTQHTFHPLTLDPRSAGKVTRFHTWERLRDQSVGEHSWQVMRILLAIWPEVPRHMLVHTMYHDVGERVTGDIPYPVKAERPELKGIMDALEEDALLQMRSWGVLGNPPDFLCDDEKAAFKLAEFIEMWEYALDELSLGNRNCALIARRCKEQAIRLINSTELPTGIGAGAVNYIHQRMEHEQHHRE